MGTGPGPAVGTFWPSPRGGTHGRIPQHSPARPHAGTPDRAARRDQDPDGDRGVRLRLGLRVRVPVGQSVPVRLNPEHLDLVQLNPVRLDVVRLDLVRLDLVRRRGAPGDTGAPRGDACTHLRAPRGAQPVNSSTPRAKSQWPPPLLARLTVTRPIPSSQCAIFRPPTSSGRSPRLSTKAATSALACALSPAMKTLGRPFSRTLRKMVLNAFTTLAPAGATLAASCATEVSSLCASPSNVALKGLLMSTMTLPARASPYSATTGTTPSYNRAVMTMSPVGTAPHLPVVAPPPRALARSSALD